ncbi:MAG: hypothetical protein WC763_05485 [Candidatus Paceibacterota bacterium]
MPTPSSLIRRLGIGSYVYNVAGHHTRLSRGFRYDIQFMTRQPDAVRSRVARRGVRMNYRGHMYTWHLRGTRKQGRSGSAVWMRLSGDLVADSRSSSSSPSPSPMSSVYRTNRRVVAATASSSPSPPRRRIRDRDTTAKRNNTPTRKRRSVQ